MLKQNWRLISQLERLGDISIILLSFLLARAGRDELVLLNQQYHWGLTFSGVELAPIKDYFIVLVVGLISYLLTLNSLGAYSSMRFRSWFQILKVAVLSSCTVLFALASTLFLFKIDLSRSFIGMFCGLSCLGILGVRVLVFKLLRFWRKRGRNFRNIIVCGIGDQAIRLAAQISSIPELGIRIRGFADLRSISGENPDGIKRFKEMLAQKVGKRPSRVISGVAGVVRVIEQCAVDEVIFADVTDVLPQIEEVMLVCAEKGVRTTMVADFFSFGVARSGISYFGDMPLIHYQTPPGDGWDLVAKRALDLSVSAAMLIILVPFFLLIAMAVKLGSPGPVFFIQRRVGLNGRLFHMYKFRSMYQNSARQLSELKDRNEMSGPVFKMKDDPRVTPVGRFFEAL